MTMIEFIGKYADTIKAGTTREEFIKSINVEPKVFNKLYDVMCRAASKNGVTLAKLPTPNERKTNEIFDALMKSNLCKEKVRPKELVPGTYKTKKGRVISAPTLEEEMKSQHNKMSYREFTKYINEKYHTNYSGASLRQKIYVIKQSMRNRGIMECNIPKLIMVK